MNILDIHLLWGISHNFFLKTCYDCCVLVYILKEF